MVMLLTAPALWQLRIGIYEFRFLALERVHLPVMQANMWRGVFGRQLRLMSDGLRAVPKGLPNWIRSDDLYTYFMTTPPPPDTPAMRRYPHVPHPYAIAAEWTENESIIEPGNSFSMQLRLFGRANDLLNMVILAFARGAQEGLGKGRGRACLDSVASVKPGKEKSEIIFRPGSSLIMAKIEPPCPPQTHSSYLRLRLLSPLRIQHQGRIMKPSSFSPQALVMNVIRRISMLQLFHEHIEMKADFRKLKAQAGLIKVLDCSLSWSDAHRYSARQKREVPAGGLLGEILLDMRPAINLFPLLWLGQYLQIGKGTTLGLGLYSITSHFDNP